MIETYNNTATLATPDTQAQTRKTLYHVKNERMGGTVPSWSAPKTQGEHIAQNLDNAQKPNTPTFENTLAYAGGQAHEPSMHEEEFGFGDLLDMVNPLHHIPVIGYAYRELTGDEIKPASQIIGGAVFGGPAGAASGLINSIVKEETGKDIASNAVDLVFQGETPSLKSTSNIKSEQLLAHASDTLEHGATQDLPANLLGFTNSSIRAESFKATRLSDTDERTAGSQPLRHYNDIESVPLSPREPITQVRLSGLYALAEN